MIDIYGAIAVGSALFIGAIPYMKGMHKEPGWLICYVDNRTDKERRQDNLYVRNIFNNIKGEAIYK